MKKSIPELIAETKLESLSRFGKLTRMEVIQYQEYLDFELLTLNRSITWNINFLKSVEKNFDWKYAYRLTSIKSDSDFIKEFESYIDLNDLFLFRPDKSWDLDFFDKYDERISVNNKIIHHPSDAERLRLLRSHKNRFNEDDWKKFSANIKIDFTEEILKEFADYFDWTALSSNQALHKKFDLLDKFQERLDWKRISSSIEDIGIVLLNPEYPLWDWDSLSLNKTFLSFIISNPEYRKISWRIVPRNRFITADGESLKILFRNYVYHSQWSLKVAEFAFFDQLFLAEGYEGQQIYDLLKQSGKSEYLLNELCEKGRFRNLKLDRKDFANNFKRLNHESMSFVRRNFDNYSEELIEANIEWILEDPKRSRHIPFSIKLIDKYNLELSDYDLANNPNYVWTWTEIESYLKEGTHPHFFSSKENIFNQLLSDVTIHDVIAEMEEFKKLGKAKNQTNKNYSNELFSDIVQLDIFQNEDKPTKTIKKAAIPLKKNQKKEPVAFEKEKEILLKSKANEKLNKVEKTKKVTSDEDVIEVNKRDETVELIYEIDADAPQVQITFTDVKKELFDKSYLFMDYETFNRDQRGGRVSQFACVRTDFNLNVYRDGALNLFCEQTVDNIPSITAALITKLTPQKILRFKSGEEKPPLSDICKDYAVLNEFDFTSRILSEMLDPRTCTLGYNSWSFDDEYTRNLAYRNLYDPYEREHREGNSRFDVYFLVLATYVQHPKLINFPRIKNKETGELEVSLKLEHLSKANNLEHLNAHDAFSDVVATILIMKLIKDRNNGFFASVLRFNDKIFCKEWIEKNTISDNSNRTPFVHISPMYGRKAHFFCPVISVCRHPKISTRNICIRLDDEDLEQSLKQIEQLDKETILMRTSGSGQKLSEKGLTRLPITFIDLNKCPIMAPLSAVESYPINRDLVSKNAVLINEKIETLKKKFDDVFNDSFNVNEWDTDRLIYFQNLTPTDKLICFNQRKLVKEDKIEEIGSSLLKNLSEEDKQEVKINFAERLVFKFKARNFPDRLTEEEKRRWLSYAYMRIRDKKFGAEIVMDEFKEELRVIKEEKLSAEDLEIVKEIEEWVVKIDSISQNYGAFFIQKGLYT